MGTSHSVVESIARRIEVFGPQLSNEGYSALLQQLAAQLHLIDDEDELDSYIYRVEWITQVVRPDWDINRPLAARTFDPKHALCKMFAARCDA